MCAHKLTDAGLMYRTKPETKNRKKELKTKMDMLRRNGTEPETAELVWREEKELSLRRKGFVEQEGFEPEVKKAKK